MGAYAEKLKDRKKLKNIDPNSINDSLAQRQYEEMSKDDMWRELVEARVIMQEQGELLKQAKKELVDQKVLLVEINKYQYKLRQYYDVVMDCYNKIDMYAEEATMFQENSLKYIEKHVIKKIIKDFRHMERVAILALGFLFFELTDDVHRKGMIDRFHKWCNSKNDYSVAPMVDKLHEKMKKEIYA